MRACTILQSRRRRNSVSRENIDCNGVFSTTHCRYEICEKYGIPYKRIGKWIVAQTPQQAQYLQLMHLRAKSLKVPTRFINIEEVKRLEPEIQAKEAVLESSSTGIIDSHSLMLYLLGQFEDRGGDIVYKATVTAILPRSGGGYDVTINSNAEDITIDAGVVINSAGLHACQVSNMLLPKERQIKPFYAKGNYFSYGISRPKPQRLIYPCPEENLPRCHSLFANAQGSLGTHLTLDLSGRVKFGPDIQWIADPTDYTVDDSRLDEVYASVAEYLPTIDRNSLNGDYAGIRYNIKLTSKSD